MKLHFVRPRAGSNLQYSTIQMDTSDAPQMIQHLSKSINYTPYEVKWIPHTSKFLLCGQHPKANGTIEVNQLAEGKLEKKSQIQHKRGVKTGTFAASPSNNLCFAFGDLEGKLSILDMEKEKVFWSVEAHEGLVNSVDGAGADGCGYGPCQLISGGRDGCVRLWDPRQDSPVLSLQPIDKDSTIADCWSVWYLGNVHNTQDRVIASGYDNGDVKIFDLKQNQLLWETNLKNGVCGLEFDRKDIIMNKLVATCLQGKFTVFDMRTFNPTEGYASLTELATKATIWGCKHLPQNRDIFATLGGNGGINLYRYNYPSQRSLKDPEGKQRGVMGKLQLLNQRELCQQPVSAFDWNKDKLGLGVLCGLDQTVKILITTKLNLY